MEEEFTSTMAHNEPASRIGLRLREGALILAVAVALYLFLAMVSYQPADPAWSTSGTNSHAMNLGGVVGAWLSDAFLYGFGLTAFFSPLMVAFSGWLLFRWGAEESSDGALHFWLLKVAGLVMAVGAASGLAMLHLSHHATALPLGAGGVMGELVGGGALAIFGGVGATLLLLAGLLTGITLFTGLSWLKLMDKLGATCLALVAIGAQWWQARKAQASEAELREQREATFIQGSAQFENREKVRVEPTVAPEKQSVREEEERQVPLFQTDDMPAMPTLSLLDMAVESQGGYSEETLQALSRLVEIKLKDFGVTVEVMEVQPGPVVTRFEMMPAAGVKASRITGLAKDLARSLSVMSVRVVEVIPGKPFVGLEIPNEVREMVRLREILGCAEYEASKAPLLVALGKDIAGRPVVADLEKMPHLLVAGTTGSGKSVGVNAMILSMLYKASPAEVRLIMVDPKMLELSIYEGIPHLLTPVVTDMKEASNALRWCVAEMERRYPLMAALGVRNIAGYNKKVNTAIEAGEPLKDPTSQEFLPGEPVPTLEPLPLIVVIIDELADMMMVVGKQVEESIARLAQKARASGIHLILATQRPSVDVITGLIKANIPTRISFQVSSRIDSRTILDQMGAEQLLGQGDMLYLPPGTSIPQRIHGAFVDDHEVHAVVNHLKENAEPNYLDEITADPAESSEGGIAGASDGESDELYDQAVQIVIESRRASISGVQRRLKVGYNRAARLIEAMEAAGVVSGMQSNGSREVLAPDRDSF